MFGVLTGELSLYLLLLQMLGVWLALLCGAIEGFWAILALLFTFASWFGLVINLVISMRSADSLRLAIDSAYPPRNDTTPGSTTNSLSATTFWQRVWKPFSIRLPNVKRQHGIVYHRNENLSLALDLYHHQDNDFSDPQAPVLLYFHGGGLLEKAGTRLGQGLPLLNALADRGWVCVSIDYRLSPRHQWPAHLQDCKSALQWVKTHIAEYGGNPNFVMTAGDSAGGQLSALMALTAHDSAQPTPASVADEQAPDNTIQGAICVYGVMDFSNLFNQSFNNDAAKLWAKTVIGADLNDPNQRHLFAAASPIAHTVSHPEPNSIPDCLIIHGTHDSLVAVDESRYFAKQLTQASENKVVYADIEGAQHGFNVFRSPRSEQVLTETVRFAELCYGCWQQTKENEREK